MSAGWLLLSPAIHESCTLARPQIYARPRSRETLAGNAPIGEVEERRGGRAG